MHTDVPLFVFYLPIVLHNSQVFVLVGDHLLQFVTLLPPQEQLKN